MNLQTSHFQKRPVGLQQYQFSKLMLFVNPEIRRFCHSGIEEWFKQNTKSSGFLPEIDFTIYLTISLSSYILGICLHLSVLTELQLNNKKNTHTQHEKTVVLQVCSVSSKYTVIRESAQTEATVLIRTTDFWGHQSQTVLGQKLSRRKLILFIMTFQFTKGVSGGCGRTSNLMVLLKHFDTAAWTVTVVWKRFSLSTLSQLNHLCFPLHINMSCDWMRDVKSLPLINFKVFNVTAFFAEP